MVYRPLASSELITTLARRALSTTCSSSNSSVPERKPDEAQAGDEAAFREIVEHYQSKVFAIIHGIVRQRNDVEDIAQQVFAKVYLSLRSFDSRSSLITWIYKITVNECFDYLRKRKVRKLVYESDLSEDEVRRVENTEPTVNRQVSADTDLARRDYVQKLLSRVSEEDR